MKNKSYIGLGVIILVFSFWFQFIQRIELILQITGDEKNLKRR